MEAILSLAQMQAIKPISEKNSAMFSQLRAECVYKELTELLGASLVNALIAEPTSERMVNILESKSFKGYDGYHRTHLGLRYMLSYFIYSRYIGQSDVADTFSGMVQKRRNETESLSDGRIRLLQNEARDIAVMQFQILKEYLELNRETYPEWKRGIDRKNFKPNFTPIRKTYR